MKIKLIIAAALFSVLVCCKKNEAKPAEKETSETTVTKNATQLKTEEVSYLANGKNYKSFVAYNPSLSSLRPVVMVIPEWWGLNDYAKSRAKQLAELGYFAFAVDFFGNGKVVSSPDEAQKLTTPFYENPAMSKSAFDAAFAQIRNFKNADKEKVAVIGYCFGGAQALNMARQEPQLKGVVSFHGNLVTGVRAGNNSVKFLVCNGANDDFVSKEEIASFKKEMDSAKINYNFIDYPNSLHSFTNPNATEIGKKFNMKIAYNKEADEKSWNDMTNFLQEIFK